MRNDLNIRKLGNSIYKIYNLYMNIGYVKIIQKSIGNEIKYMHSQEDKKLLI